jgi:hypothetical protein
MHSNIGTREIEILTNMKVELVPLDIPLERIDYTLDILENSMISSWIGHHLEDDIRFTVPNLYAFGAY